MSIYGPKDLEHWFRYHLAHRNIGFIYKPHGCWEWQGNLDSFGYGASGHKKSHRMMYMFVHKVRLKSADLVCHHCDNPKCCRPSHLYKGTYQTNMDDKMARGRHACNRKLTEEDISKIRNVYSSRTQTQSRIAKEYGVSQTLISAIVKNQIWTHVK